MGLRVLFCMAGCWMVGLYSAAAAADPYPQTGVIDVLHYRFEIELRNDTDRIVGSAGLRIKVLKDDTRQVRLDLVQKSASRGNKGMRVTSVVDNGKPLRYSHENDVLLVDLAEPANRAEVVEFTVDYEGEPETGLIVGDNKYQERTFFSDNWPDKARNWLPTFDHISDKSTSEFLVTAPNQLQVVSNGLLLEHSDLGDGRRLTHWKQSVPVAPWLFVLGAAQFAVQYVDEFDGKSIQTWVYRQDRDDGFYDFAVPTRAALEFYSAYVGPFEYEKLANIQSNSVGGGMEAASAILYSEESVTGQRTDRWQTVIVHEIAHQWFGNSVTEADWDHVWLSEGFATYFAFLFFEHAYGRDRFLQKLLASRDKVYEFYAENPYYRLVHEDLREMAEVTTGQTYNKGAWVLHMLRNRMGEQQWWSGIRSYYASHRNGHATTDDFQAVMESACGCELAGFFHQWLYQGGNPVLGGEWHYDESASAIEVNIAQLQEDGHVFDLLVEVGVFSAGSPVPAIHQLNLSKKRGEISIPVEAEPDSVTLDPRSTLLAQWKFEKRQ